MTGGMLAMNNKNTPARESEADTFPGHWGILLAPGKSQEETWTVNTDVR